MVNLIGILSYDGFTKSESPGSIIHSANVSVGPPAYSPIPLSFGLLMAGFCGHSGKLRFTVVFPQIYHDMKQPEKYPKLLNLSYLIVVLIYGFVGVIGYFMFGSDTKDEVIITQNIPLVPEYNMILTNLMIGLVAINAFTKYPISISPVNAQMEQIFSYFFKMNPSVRRLLSIIISGGLILFIAVSVPEFHKVMALLGSVFAFTVSVIFPSCCYMSLFGSELSKFEWAVEILITSAGRSNFSHSLFNSVNILMGTGLLSLPFAFSITGYRLGLFLLVLYGIITHHTGKHLGKCLNKCKANDEAGFTYSDIGQAAFGTAGRTFISIIFFLELGTAAVALVILTADSVAALFPQFDLFYVKVIVTCLVIPATWPRSLSIISYISLIGIIAMVNLIGILSFDGLTKPDTPGSIIKIADISANPPLYSPIPLSFGLLMAGFCGHSGNFSLTNSVFPQIYHDMKQPEKYHKLLNLSYLIVVLVYGFVGIVGYLMFGSNTKDEITKNIPLVPEYNKVLTNLMIGLVATNAFTKYPISISPVNSQLEQVMSYFFKIQPNLRRVVTIILSGGIILFISVSVPEFHKVMALLGSVFAFTVSVIFPSCCYMSLFGPKLTRFEWAVEIFITVAGIIMGGLGTKGRSNFSNSLFNSVNILMGTGLLSLPFAFSITGYGLGLILLVLFAVITHHTGMLLGKCLNKCKANDEAGFTYSDIGQAAFGIPGRTFISILFFLELGTVAVALVILTADSIVALFPKYDPMYVKIIVASSIIPVTWPRSLSLISYISLIGIIAMGNLIGILSYNGLSKQESPGSIIHSVPVNAVPPSYSHIPLAFGLLMAGFCGHSGINDLIIVFPQIYHDMRQPEKYNRLLNYSYLIVVFIYGFVGVIGYLMFGADTKDEITQNIPLIPEYNKILSNLMIGLVAINAFTKYPISISPLNSQLEEIIRYFFDLKPTIRRLLAITFSGGLILFISVSVPEFHKVMALLGSVFAFTVSVVFPSCCYMSLFGQQLSKLEWAVEILITGSGIVMGSLGTAWVFL
ncbi:hypothetical protein HDV06_004843 [Boothiomyces sp. JEL0866]|nr:hypothetical protein HDV06_004843 [Boothiomyces sp. JEL0866]